MHAQYQIALVAVSLAIALLAAYTALDLANALSHARGRSRALWLGGGALAMGVGVWSMHFVGMLAFRLPGVTIGYGLPLLLVSAAVAVAASGVALWVVSRAAVSRLELVAAGALMSASIAGMHYLGVASMGLGTAIRWNLALVGASVAVAAVASAVALGYAFGQRGADGRIALRRRLVGAIVLGVAITGMHYTAMAAMHVEPGAGRAAPGTRYVLATDALALAIALATVVILAIAVAGARIDRALARRMGLALENERLFLDAERARREADLDRAAAERARAQAEQAQAEAERARQEAEAARHAAERHASEERVLRRATRELGGAEDLNGVADALVRSALRLAPADAAYVEARDRHGEREHVQVVAVHGEGGPVPGTRVPYPGSLTREILDAGGPGLLRELGNDAAVPTYLREACARCTALVVPLAAGGTVEGALVLLRAAGEELFEEEPMRAIAALADTAAAALRRVGLVEALRESEQRLRQLAENIREVFWVLDLDSGRMSYVSPGYEQIWGRPRKELYADGMAFTRAIHPDDRERVAALLADIADGSYDVEYRIIRPDGDSRWIHARGSPVRDARGRSFRIAGIAEDITIRKEVEEAQRFLIGAGAALASSLDYTETLRVTARLAVPDVADWCAIDVLEDGAVRRLAVAHPDPEREALVRELGERYPPDPDAPTGVPNVLRTGQPELIRHVDDNLLRVVAQDDEQLRMLRTLGLRSAMIVPMIARGRTLGAITFVVSDSGRPYEERDVSLGHELALRAALAVDNARLFRDAEQRRVELERVMESRERLMRGFSHDLKNPLGAADGYAQLLEDGVYGTLSPEQLHSVQRLRTTIASALRLIHDLLELARAESGAVDVRPQPTDIGRTIAETTADYQALAETASLTMDVELCDGLPLIMTDPNRTRQVLGNLISNAVKYTPPGGAVRVRVCEDSNGSAPAPGEWVRVDVIDTGPGIPEDQQPLLFREFQRLDPGEKNGAGLGLAISRRIARALSGEITVQSEPGAGARFTLWLPRIEESAG